MILMVIIQERKDGADMPIRIGINGFGRIGRLDFRTMSLKYPGAIEIVAVNDLTDAKTNAFLLEHDSSHGKFLGDIDSDDEGMIVNGRRVQVYHEREPG